MKRRALTLLIALFVGCGSPPDAAPEQGSPLQEEGAGAAVGSGTAPLASLSLAQALATADADHPELAEFRAYVQAAEGQGDQAGLFPNPTLVLRMENAPWSEGSTRNEAEYVAGLTLQLPLSGRLGASEDVAARQLDQRLAELAAQRREVHGRVRGAFATALSLERAAAIQDQARALAGRAVELLEARVEAGDAVPADLARVQIEATRAKHTRRRGGGWQRGWCEPR